MSFMNKIKDFFYDEEFVDEEYEEKPKKKKTVENISESKTKKINIYDIEKEKNKFDVKSKINEKKVRETDDLSERDLFKAERTFNFPMSMDDEEEQEEKKIEEKKVVKEKPKQTRTKRSSYSYTPFSMPKKEEKHFKPTPVVSPIYGILDQNYKKEDIEESSKTKEFSFDKKVDFDTIRNKAYKTLDDEIEKTIHDKKTDLFYDIEESKKGKHEEKTKEEIKKEYEEKPYQKDEVVITYDEVDDEDFDIPKITRSRKNKNVEAKDASDKEEQDLFKIIDNMYKTEEEGDE